MKKDRNCNNVPYPVYPTMMPIMGNMPVMGNMPIYPQSSLSGIDQQINTLNNKVSMLEKRVSALESMSTTANPIPINNYNDSNYYMV